jgi:aspartyl-tRNA(Asn)/glutamyl-tRNA(Gln) amidotransferase subunit B
MEFEAVIGLEVHAQLLTETKIFCGCSTKFGKDPNENTCTVCLGLPGALPVLNKKAVEYAMKMALATDCKIAPLNIFARKNYFYPDLPKGYQISQYELPIAEHGHVSIDVEGKKKDIGITRIHMEEDAGKLVHDGVGIDTNFSYVDLNRACVPLIEIVSEPDICSPQEASAYLKKLRQILVYLDICDGNMEEGSLRCDVNVSIRPVGQKEFGTRAELKNMNSFKFIEKALDYEIKRQINAVNNGEKIVQETRLFDSAKGITMSMRAKEDAHDYRYFPDPDLVPLRIDKEWIKEVKGTLCELPDAKVKRFVSEYKIPEYDAEVLSTSKQLASYYEETVKHVNEPKAVSNWIMGDILRELKNDNIEIDDCPVTPGMLAEMIKLISDDVISSKIAKTVFEEMYKTKKAPGDIVKEKGLVQVTDTSAIENIVDEVIAANPNQVEQFRSGKDKLFGYFVGQVMKLSRGKANPKIVNEILREKLK